MNRLVKLARERVNEELRTHWEGCEAEHRECLIQRLADEVERLNEELAKYADHPVPAANNPTIQQLLVQSTERTIALQKLHKQAEELYKAVREAQHQRDEALAQIEAVHKWHAKGEELFGNRHKLGFLFDLGVWWAERTRRCN
jgi:plasmid stability protein